MPRSKRRRCPDRPLPKRTYSVAERALILRFLELRKPEAEKQARYWFDWCSVQGENPDTAALTNLKHWQKMLAALDWLASRLTRREIPGEVKPLMRRK